MLVSCITGAARREIIPFYQTGVAFERYETGVAFERYETGVFFTEMMTRFSQQKYNESQENEYLDKKQKKEEDTRRVHTVNMKLYRKQEYLDRKQESGEDTREYYTSKETLFLQAYAPDKRSLVEFKDKMLKGMYN